MPTTDELRTLITSNLPDNLVGEIDAKDMRDVLRYIADIVDALVTGNIKGFASRAAAVNSLPIPASAGGGRIITIEGDSLVVRSPTLQADDPLSVTDPYWGVAFRLPGFTAMTAAINAVSNLGDSLALQTDTEASTGQMIVASIPSAQTHISLSAGQMLRFRCPFANTEPDPVITVGGMEFVIKARNGSALAAGDLQNGQRYLGYIFWNAPDRKEIRLSESVRMSDISGLADAITGETAAREAGDTASRDRANHTGTQPMGSVDGLEADLTAKQEAITTTDGIARRADDRAAPLEVDGEGGNPDYIFSVGDSAGNQLMGFHTPRQMLDLGFPLAFGPGSAYVSGDDAEYVLSIEDENGYPAFAIGRDGTIYGAAVAGGSQAGVDVEGFAAKRAASETPILDDDDQTRVEPFTTTREVYVGVPFRGANYASGEAGAGVDVGWLPPAGEVNIELNHDAAYIYSSLGFGGTAHNTLTRTPGVYTVVRAFRLGQKIVYQALVGSVVESTTAPIRARSIAFGGQSHIQGGFRQGVAAGVLDGLANVQWRTGNNWMPSPVYWTPHCINGATGETAISSASKPVGSNSYWWHRVNQTDGPALTTWKTRISDAVTAGQPVPEDVIWAQGEGDTESTAAGTLTLADLWTDMSALFAEMRSFLIGLGATNPQFYIGMLGRGEGTALKAKAQGYTAVRQNYLRLIAETAWVHYACELYDLPGAFNDIHYGFLGHYTHGYRYSRAIANVREGQSNSLGPQITSATLEDGGRSVRLTISGTDLRMPSNPAPPWIIPAGGDAQSPPVPVTRVRVDGTDLVVSAAQDLTGCRLAYPSGAVINPRGDSIVYDLASSHVKMPGLPLRSFITAPLA